MDLLLCHSYFLEQDPPEQRVMKPYPPLGLLCLSSFLKRKGMSVGVVDTTFSHYAAVEREIHAARPFVVGIYTNLMTRRHVLAIAAMARSAGALVVFGGPEAVNYAEQYLVHGDVIVSGEGEATLAELVPHLREFGLTKLHDVRGILFRDGDAIASTPPRDLIRDVDALPFPDRAAIDMERYLDTWKRHHGVRSISLITARGCPYRCQWCSHSVFGHTYRHRSPENVIQELLELRDAYRPDQVWYADDVFTMNHKWLDRFAEQLDAHGLSFPFESISREDRLNEDVVRTLKRMGCYRVWIGAESGSQRVLDAMERRTNAVRMREMIALLKDYGIRAGTFIMVGYEGERFADLRRTVDHLKAALPDDVLSTLSYPIKGTPYYDRVVDRIVPPEDWAQGSDRDIRIRGRRSRRYYAAAEAWIASEVQLARSLRGGLPGMLRAPRSFLNLWRNRLRMWKARNEQEVA